MFAGFAGEWCRRVVESPSRNGVLLVERACMMQGDMGMAGGRENAMANVERRRRAKRAPTAGAISRASEVRACVVGWSDT